MPVIKTKQYGETADKFKVLVTNGNPVPQGTVAGNIIVANGDGTVKDSGINAEELKKSVADGKKALASAISEKGIATASDASFATMAGNIGELSSSGEYVWRRYEVVDGAMGEFVDYISDKDSTKYPQSGLHTDGLWYESDKGNILPENIVSGIDIFGVVGNVKKAEECEILFTDYFTSNSQTKTFVIPDGYDVSKVGISAISTNRTTAGIPTISYSFSGNTLTITHSSSYFSSNGKTDYPIAIGYFPFAKSINYYSLSSSGTLANDEKKSFVFAYPGDTPSKIQRTGTTVSYADGIDGAARCLCSEVVFA